MTDTKAIELKAGTSYWIDFIHATKGKLKVALTAVDVHGHLMGESFDGHRFNLPERIVHAHPMNEFQRVRWLSRCHKRAGNLDKADDLLNESYYAMPGAFYLTRIERLTHIWAGRSNGLLQEYVDELRRFRPDLPVDELSFVREQKAKALAALERFEEDNEPDASGFAGRLKSFAKSIGQVFVRA